MPSQYAGDELFPEDFTILDDGEPITNAAVFNVALEALGDRTIWLRAAAISIQGQMTSLLSDGFPSGWPLLHPSNAARDHVEWMHFHYSDAVGDNWLDGHENVNTLGSVLGQCAPDALWFPIRKLRNGARLKSVRVYYTTTPVHVDVPAALPQAALYRLSFGAAATVVIATALADTPADEVEWNAASTPPPYINLVATDPDGVLVSDAYAYFIKIVDEQGAGALAGNRYWGARLEWEISEVQP